MNIQNPNALTYAPLLNTKVPFRRLKTHRVEKALEINEDYNRAVQAQEKDLERMYENFKMYWGVDYGQWDQSIVAKLLDVQRTPGTFNIASQKINTLAGAIISAWKDVEFQPIDGSRNSLTLDFKDLFLTIKRLMEWDKSYQTCTLYGLIIQGVEQMVIDRMLDPNGHIRFITKDPGYTLFDPYWRSQHPRDCEKAWVEAWMTPEQIIEKYNVSKADVMVHLAVTEKYGQYYEYNELDWNKDRFRDRVAGQFKIIEQHRMESVETVRLVDISKGMSGLPFPVMDPEKDKEYLMAWGHANNANWEYVKEMPYKDRILMIETIAPALSLNMILEDAPSEIQVRRLDLFPWSADRVNGKNRGIIDILKDAQKTFNKRESQKNDMINSAASGAKLFNSQLFKDGVKLERVKKNVNNPSFVDDVDLDDVKTPYITLKNDSYDPGLFQDQTLMIDLIDRITPVPSAMSARQESAKESGILYQSKVAVAEIGMKTLNESLNWHQHDKYMAFYLQAQNTYRATYRKFTTVDGKRTIEFNRKDEIGGVPVVINNISALPLVNVVIKEDPRGLMVRHMNRVVYAELLQSIPPELTLFRSLLTSLITSTLDVPEDDQEMVKAVSALEMMKAIQSWKTQMKGLMANEKQADMLIAQVEQQLQQMQAPQQQQAPQQFTPEGEQPVEPGGTEKQLAAAESRMLPGAGGERTQGLGGPSKIISEALSE